MELDPNAIGWVCPECNTFWRDNNMTPTYREECPFDHSPRSKGRELILNLVKDKEYETSKLE